MTVAKGWLWVVFDNLRSIGRLDEHFQFRDPDNILVGEAGTDSQFEVCEFVVCACGVGVRGGGMRAAHKRGQKKGACANKKTPPPPPPPPSLPPRRRRSPPFHDPRGVPSHTPRTHTHHTPAHY